MNCEMPDWGPPREPYRLRLDLFGGLPLDHGHRLVSEWRHAASLHQEQEPDNGFTPFIYTWIAINGWASISTDSRDARREPSDRDLVRLMMHEPRMGEDFERACQLNQATALAAQEFAGWLPILRADEERRLYYGTDQRPQQGGEYRRGRLLRTFSDHPEIRHAPSCGAGHLMRGEAVPADWLHLLPAIYQVRCNLFHGEKSARSPDDATIVLNAFMLLSAFFDFAGYMDV